MVDLRWAPPSRDDDPDWVALLAAIEDVDERGETYEVADLGDEWDSVWSHPETDAQLRVGRPRARGLRLAEGHARAAEAPPGGLLGRRAAVPPASRDRLGAVRVVAAARHRDRGAVRRLPPGRDGHRRGRSAARPRRRVDEGRLCGGPDVPGAGSTRHRARVARPGPGRSRARAVERRARRGGAPGPRRSLPGPLGQRAAQRRGVGAVVHGAPQLPARPLGARRRLRQRPGRRTGAHGRLPPGLGAPAARGVDQHGRHPAGLARQGGGAVADERRPPAHRRRRLRLRARHPRCRLREPHRAPSACTAASATRTSAPCSASLEPSADR